MTVFALQRSASIPATSLSWGGFDGDTSSFLCVPLIHAVLRTHGANAVYPARALVGLYGYDWDVWVAMYRGDFEDRGITSHTANVGTGYIDANVQTRLLAPLEDGGESRLDPLTSQQIQACYHLMRADVRNGRDPRLNPSLNATSLSSSFISTC